jgi:hypothetical protein
VTDGKSDASIPFDGLCNMLRKVGFRERIKGSHHIYTKDGVPEIINLQPDNGKAKAYQVRQVRGILMKYNL